MNRYKRTAFTLVELLVVIAIIGMLVALLLPAVQAARGAARKVQCKSHLKQIALGWLTHHEAQGYFPIGGWPHYDWVGDPDLGFGLKQPGNWAYNVLPYLEEDSIHAIGTGLTQPDVPVARNIAKRRAGRRIIESGPLGIFHCPNRRPAILYPSGYQLERGAKLVKLLVNATVPRLAAKIDYAANGGVYPWRVEGEGLRLPKGFVPPDRLVEGNDPNFSWPGKRNYTGAVYMRTKVSNRKIIDGVSHMYMLGEKYLSPDEYDAPKYHTNVINISGDQRGAFVGWNESQIRWCNNCPRRDRPQYRASRSFGSAHRSSFHMAMCDGAVRTIDYEIDILTHRQQGNRWDGGGLVNYFRSRCEEIPTIAILIGPNGPGF